MSTLLENFNPEYSAKAAGLTKKPYRVVVEVEDSIDKFFWEDILVGQFPEKEFHFAPFHTIIEGEEKKVFKGKSHIMAMLDKLKPHHIGCVDSDNDWILEDYTKDGKRMANCQFLLQTYAYSIENLMYHPATLGAACQEACMEATDFDFSGYIGRLSEIVYPLLVWSLYLTSRHSVDFTPTKWQNILVGVFSNPEEALGSVQQKVAEAIADIEAKNKELVSEKELFEKEYLSGKDINPANAYLYVRGHDLASHLLNAMLTKITKQKHLEHIIRLKVEKEEAELGKALQEYRKATKPIDSILERNYRYKEYSHIYPLIQRDAAAIWN